jgi:hypothetical protein
MLVLGDRQTKQILGSLFASSLVAIGGCSGSAAIESALSPDPQLQNAIETTKLEEGGKTTSTSIENRTQPPTTANSKSLELLPEQIPIYPQATLQTIEPDSTPNRGKAHWDSPEAIKPIARYYQDELTSRSWKILRPFDLQATELNQVAIATKDNLEITIALENSPIEAQKAARHTQLTIAYNFLNNKTNIDNPAQESTSPTSAVTPNKNGKERIYFTDLDEVPEQLREYVNNVAALGILSPYTQEGNVELSKFAPDRPVTRSEYANWLIAANNIYHANSPGDKIYLANKSDRVAFQDVKNNDPNFGAIQGLAEAGLVPSMLSDDSTKLLFQPNAPLTRIDLISWKVPLDVRKALPQASLDAISKSWGFQDVTKVDPEQLKALFADFQNGDRSNIRRIFGYTTLFQPQKPVTRAEAAASLWYFGYQGDGITAKEAAAIEP